MVGVNDFVYLEAAIHVIVRRLSRTYSSGEDN